MKSTDRADRILSEFAEITDAAAPPPRLKERHRTGGGAMAVVSAAVAATAIVAALFVVVPQGSEPRSAGGISLAPSSDAAPTRSDAVTTRSDAVPTMRESPPASPASDARPSSSPVASPTAAYPPEGLPRMENTVEWAFLGSFKEIVEAADIFIVGDVLAVAPAPPAPDRGRGRLPGTNSTIRVTQIVKGRSETGDTITVYQTGGVYRPTHAIKDQQGSPAPLPPEAPPGAKPQPPASIAPLYLLELEDDPLFRVGERAALALAWDPGRLAYLVVSGPQGRFQVDERGKVHPMVDDPAVSSLDGISLDELISRVAAASASSGVTPRRRPG